MDTRNSAQIFLAVIVTAGFFFCVYRMLTDGFPPENKDALNSLLGVLTTIFTLQMNFFFGSSTASKAKDDTINEIAKATPLTGTGAGIAPVVIPDAQNVQVKTDKGDVNLTNPKDPS